MTLKIDSPFRRNLGLYPFSPWDFGPPLHQAAKLRTAKGRMLVTGSILEVAEDVGYRTTADGQTDGRTYVTGIILYIIILELSLLKFLEVFKGSDLMGSVGTHSDGQYVPNDVTMLFSKRMTFATQTKSTFHHATFRGFARKVLGIFRVKVEFERTLGRLLKKWHVQTFQHFYILNL